MYQKKITPLTLREALELHRILGEYLPEIDTNNEELDVLEYSQAIMANIIDDSQPRAFAQALGMMTKLDLRTLISMNDQDRLLLFMKCVGVNRLWLLNEMLRNINYGTSR